MTSPSLTWPAKEISPRAAVFSEALPGVTAASTPAVILETERAEPALFNVGALTAPTVLYDILIPPDSPAATVKPSSL